MLSVVGHEINWHGMSTVNEFGKTELHSRIFFVSHPNSNRHGFGGVRVISLSMKSLTSLKPLSEGHSDWRWYLEKGFHRLTNHKFVPQIDSTS